MLKATLAFCTAIVSASALSADADSLRPKAARSFDLKEQTAVIFFTAENDGCRVVTTVGPNLGYTGSRMRFESIVPKSGQASFSIAGAPSVADAPIVNVTCLGDSITANLEQAEQFAAAR